MTPQTTTATPADDLQTFRAGVNAASSHPLVPKPAVAALQAAGRLIESLQRDVQELRERIPGKPCEGCTGQAPRDEAGMHMLAYAAGADDPEALGI